MNNDLTVYLQSQNGTTTGMYMVFGANQTGTYPLDYLSVNNLQISPAQSANVTTTVTTFPAVVNDYFIGTFGGSFQSSQGANHTISGNYRVKRDY
jgi:hypothetical protein